MPRRKPQFAPPDGPAIIREDHAKVRVISPVAGYPKAWKRLSTLEQAFHKRQLRGGSSRFTENQRFEAGSNYAQIFLTANGAGGKDSTQALNVSQSNRGFEPSQSAQSAIFLLAQIETHMGARDCRIIRRICGEGHKPAEVIRDICADYQDTVSARLREALDSLIEAFDTQRGDKRHRGAA